MTTTSFPVGTLGVDKTGGVINSDEAAGIYAAGYRFVLRDIGLPNISHSQTNQLSGTEVEVLHGVGLRVGIFQLTYEQTSVSTDQGGADADYLVERANACGAPANTTLWFDLEGNMGGASAASVLDYINAWAAKVVAAGYGAGLYAGNYGGLSSSEISNFHDIHAYWQAGQLVSYSAPLRGFQLYQLNPPAQTVAGTYVDLNVAQVDFEGGSTQFF